MRTLPKVFVSISIMCFSFAAQAQFHFGARAGNNLANMISAENYFPDETIKDKIDTVISKNISFHFWGIVQYEVSKLSDVFRLESGIFLTQLAAFSIN